MDIGVRTILEAIFVLTPIMIFVAQKAGVLPIRSNKILWLLSFVSLYICFVYSAQLQREHLNMELSKYDLNGDGIYQEREITDEAYEAMLNASSDTAITFAPYTGILVAGLYNTIIFITVKLGFWLFGRFNLTNCSS